ncbi:MAG: hypothetical protein HOV80_34175 [Polyangiaceae bacterium]|nr:hypothetical protein [Polyangiaceae bacterium]
MRAALLGLSMLAACSGSSKGLDDAPTSEPSSSSAPIGSSMATNDASARPDDAPWPKTKIDALLVRDQPPSEGLERWDGSIVVRVAPPRRLDLAARTSRPVTIEGAAAVLDLATYKKQPVALVKTGDERWLAIKEGGSFKRVELPAAFRSAKSKNPPGDPRIAADDNEIVLQHGTMLQRYDGNAWSAVSITGIKDSPSTMGVFASSLLLHRGALWLAFDRGEWGGALYSVDLASGKARKEDGPDLPVRDIEVDGQGALWVVRGLAHLGLREGDLRVLSNGAWKLVASSEDDTKAPASKIAETAFDAVAFDAEGKPIMLTGNKGLLRQQGSAWVPLLRDWPEFVYVQDLEIEGDKIVIATYDAGILLVDLPTSNATRITLVD